MGQEYLREGEDVVYMHADTLCAPQIFEEMLREKGDLVLLVDFRECDEEAMKVRTEAGRVVEISKQISCDLAEGEFIGIARINGTLLADVKKAAKQLMKEKQFTSYFEGAIQYLIDRDKCEVITIPTRGSFWGEIDFIEDYERVKREISPDLVRIAGKEYSR